MRNVLLVDFDGVLSNGKFYESISRKNNGLTRHIQSYLFSPERDELVKEWMRGKYSYEQIHQIASKDIQVQEDELNQLLARSVKEFTLNMPLLDHIARLRKNEWSVYLYTDNMDIFDRVSVPYFDLEERFDAIYSSSDYGHLKFEDASLLSILKNEQAITQETIYLVDDKVHQEAIKAGVYSFHYTDWSLQSDFEKWLGQ